MLGRAPTRFALGAVDSVDPFALLTYSVYMCLDGKARVGAEGDAPRAGEVMNRSVWVAALDVPRLCCRRGRCVSSLLYRRICLPRVNEIEQGERMPSLPSRRLGNVLKMNA